MKTFLLLLLLAPASGVGTDPITEVVAMLSRLQQYVINEGEQEQKIYNEASEMCSDRSRQLHQEIKTGKAQVSELTATIEKGAADLAMLQEKISDLVDQTSDDDSELQKATSERSKESANFRADDTQLQTLISALERAIVVIERDGPKASSEQVEHMQSVTQLLQTMVEASAVDSYDAATLTALLQAPNSGSEKASEDSDGDDDATGAPAAAIYKGQSSAIIETLEGLLDKVRGQLDETRQAEAKNMNAYELFKQAMESKLKTMAQEMGETKKSHAETKEKKASAEGDHQTTSKDLAEDVAVLRELHHECLEKATAFEDSTTSRDEELKALTEAKKIISGSTGGAAKQSYAMAQTSFLQVRSKDLSTESLNAATNAVHVVRRLSLDSHSGALMELSNRMSTVIKGSALAGKSPFAKVRGLLESMISKLSAAADSEATKKAYCDKELGESGTSKEDKEDTIEQLKVKIDGMTTASKKLKGGVVVLRKELAASLKTTAETSKIRAEEKANYDKNKPLMVQGLEGVKTALRILRDYYGKGDSSYSKGAGDGIIGILEVIESDFAKGLAVLTSVEETAETEYETVTNENAIARVAKEQDAKYKTAQYVALDKSISEARSDKSGVGEELAAVTEYLSSIKKECIAKLDSYQERRERREKQMAGLHQAMESLSGESVFFFQLSTSRKALRGARRLEAST